MLATATDIVRFWFGDEFQGSMPAAEQRKIWFTATREWDASIRLRFMETMNCAARGELNDWLDSAHGGLALILLLDQFPRNAFRGTARAFSTDGLALTCLQHVLEHKLERGLALIEQSFILMPLMHAEDVTRQQLSLELFQALLSKAQSNNEPCELLEYLERTLNYARGHLALIERFGRFPHRNKALGRESSHEELAYLQDDGRHFGQ